jgi:transaldolase
VADTGDFEKIAAFRPQDSTTNPSLISAAARLPQYAALVADAVAYGRAKAAAGGAAAERLELVMDKLAVNFGCEILKLVPGYVSTELDARLSFDTARSLARARRIIALYAEQGIGKERVLVKLASTWESIRAAEVLEKEGIVGGAVRARACAPNTSTYSLVCLALRRLGSPFIVAPPPAPLRPLRRPASRRPSAARRAAH